MFNEKKTYYDTEGRKHVVGSDGLGGRLTLLVAAANESIPHRFIQECDMIIVMDPVRYKFAVMRNRLDNFHGEGTSVSKLYEKHVAASRRLVRTGQILISSSLTQHIDKINSDIRNLYAFRRYYLLL